MGDKAVTRYIGSEGAIDFGWSKFTITKSKMPEAPGFGGWDSYDTYPEKMQKEIADQYNKRWTKDQQSTPEFKPIAYSVPEGYDDRLDHFTNFFESMRTGKPVVEDGCIWLPCSSAMHCL